MQAVLDGEKLELRRYRKRELLRYFIPTLELASAGTAIQVPTLEGPIRVLADPDMYIMVGVNADPYPMRRSSFEARYRETDGDTAVLADFLARQGWSRAAVRCCLPLRPYYVYAAPVNRVFQVYLEGYGAVLHGKPGDYYAVPAEDPAAPYIIQADIMEKSYAPD